MDNLSLISNYKMFFNVNLKVQDIPQLKLINLFLIALQHFCIYLSNRKIKFKFINQKGLIKQTYIFIKLLFQTNKKRNFYFNPMRLDKSKSTFMKFNASNQTLKKESTLQKQAAKRYFEFKKSASQPSYFLSKSRLKKINEIYRAISMEKLSKNYSLQKSKSLHNSVTPEKKSSFYNNHSYKKPSCLNTLNLNRALQSSQKTKRLRLNTRNQQNNGFAQTNSTVQAIKESGTKYLLKQLQKLQQISNMSIQKAFVGQYDMFFKALKENNLTNRVGTLSQIKFLLSKFCNLMYICQQRMRKIAQKQMKSRHDKLQMDFSSTNTQLKKKSLKLELLIKQINQLKDHNIKLSTQLSEMRQKNKAQKQNESSSVNENSHALNGVKSNHKIGSKIKIGNFQINNIFQMKISQSQAQIITRSCHQLTLDQKGSKQQLNNRNKEHQSDGSQDSDSTISYFYKNQPLNTLENGNCLIKNNQQNQQAQNQFLANKSPLANYEGSNPQNKKSEPLNQKVQMIKHIRHLQKKQKQLIKTLMILKHDGIDIERAFNQAISGQYNQSVEQCSFEMPKVKISKSIKRIQNKDSYDADNSIIESIDGLTVRYLQGECEQDMIFYPIKHEYKSKPLDPTMQDKLRLDFNALYEQEDEYQDDEKQVQIQQKDLPTI